MKLLGNISTEIRHITYHLCQKQAQDKPSVLLISDDLIIMPDRFDVPIKM